jgi:Zn-dependent protease
VLAVVIACVHALLLWRNVLTPLSEVGQILNFAVFTNFVLFVFNLLPVPPLDGGNVLGAMLPRHIAETFDQMRPYGFLIIVGLIAAGYIVYVESIRDTIVSLLI